MLLGYYIRLFESHAKLSADQIKEKKVSFCLYSIQSLSTFFLLSIMKLYVKHAMMKSIIINLRFILSRRSTINATKYRIMRASWQILVQFYYTLVGEMVGLMGSRQFSKEEIEQNVLWRWNNVIYIENMQKAQKWKKFCHVVKLFHSYFFKIFFCESVYFFFFSHISVGEDVKKAMEQLTVELKSVKVELRVALRW